MSNINDFKIIKQKSLKYFELLEKYCELERVDIDESKKAILGFYLFALEIITGEKDLDKIVDIITDTEFNSIVLNRRDEDKGIDAIYIDEENKLIQLFNFKFKEKFDNNNSELTINEQIISSKFLSAAISGGSLQGFSGKIKDFAENIVNKINSNEVWNIEYCVVCNLDIRNTESPPSEIKNMVQQYGLSLKIYDLQKLSDLISLKPSPINAKVLVETHAAMKISEDSLSSSQSYIIRMPLSEVVRITCKDQTVREKYSVDDLSTLSHQELEYSILFDNVRGFIVKSKFNKNIVATIKEEPFNFFLYNNGITIVSNKLSASPYYGDKKFLIKLNSIQVINGGQTLRAIHKFNSEDKDNIKKLSSAHIAVRIFEVSSEDLKNKIAEYTNSQNAISNIDLKSIRTEQLNIEQYLSDQKIQYVRKSGDTGLDDKNYEYRISIERFGQILSSIKGDPDKASNNKKQLFDKDYNKLFVDDFDINKSQDYVRKYYEIESLYKKTNFDKSDQKIFYIMYIFYKHNISDIICIINSFEEILNKFDVDSQLSKARKLIRKDFKTFLDNNINKK